jgi:hypothetical protein
LAGHLHPLRLPSPSLDLRNPRVPSQVGKVRANLPTLLLLGLLHRQGVLPSLDHIPDSTAHGRRTVVHRSWLAGYSDRRLHAPLHL